MPVERVVAVPGEGAAPEATAVDEHKPLAGAIDVHAHYLTAEYRDACGLAGHAAPDGIPALPDWSVEESLELMDKVGIAASLLSISSPGVFFGEQDSATRLAREVNEAGARVVSERPTRFGLLASLPLPDLDAALAEVVYAFDTLSADGVALLTNYGGTYISDVRFEPLLQELDRRSAVAFIHPASSACWQAVSFGRPRPLLEFLLDTTRSVIDLALSGTLTRNPNIRFIIPHSGGALPIVADRAHLLGAYFRDPGTDVVDVLSELSKLHYDLAGTPLPRALPALLGLVAPDRLLYGSDFPFTPPFAVEALAQALASTDLVTDLAREAMVRHNAIKLFPRLATE
ncbi:MAG TPA: amidohydrolase family protein [Solirubrobacteraceae bacterium]|jgi:predicted TIM-barrel fold metal-dependent hydrolase|nr:amidohydrolase family protein [Solirubrobacteraceae bacterium]